MLPGQRGLSTQQKTLDTSAYSDVLNSFFFLDMFFRKILGHTKQCKKKILRSQVQTKANDKYH